MNSSNPSKFLLICPVCQANQQQEQVCRRCKSDLGLVVAIEEKRIYHLSLAFAYLQKEEYQIALEQLHAAEQLRQGSDIKKYRAVVHLIANDFPKAWQLYNELVTEE